MLRQLEADQLPHYASSFLLTFHQGLCFNNDADEEAKNDFYDQWQKILNGVPRHGICLVAGDWMEKFGVVRERSDNEERFVSLSTMFLYKEINRYIWSSNIG